MQLSVVQDNQAGEPREIWPHVIVTWRVSDLIDDEIVFPPVVHPQKVVRVEQAHSRIRRNDPIGSPVDVHVDVVIGCERRQQLVAVLRDAGFSWRERSEPRETWHWTGKTLSLI